MTGSKEKKTYVIVTGGGTGGHVFPAIAICDELTRRNIPVLYVGSPRGLEARLAPEHDIPFITINTGQVKNMGLFRLFLNLMQTLACCFWAFFYLIKNRPGAVVGVGGYVAFPMMLAAVPLRIPLFIQEQNVTAGIANRAVARFARMIFLGFEKAKGSLGHSRHIVTGNPIRRIFHSDRFKDYSPTPPHLLIMGGSQGARAINLAIISFLPKLMERFPELTITHQTGKLDFDRVVEAYKKLETKHSVVPFIKEMADAYAQASLIVCRSGALTVSELLAVNRPSIFVPYPRKGQNDQTANAYYMKDLGISEVVEQGEEFENRLWETLIQTLEPSRLQHMHAPFSRLHRTSALATIGDHIEKTLHR